MSGNESDRGFSGYFEACTFSTWSEYGVFTDCIEFGISVFQKIGDD